MLFSQQSTYEPPPPALWRLLPFWSNLANRSTDGMGKRGKTNKDDKIVHDHIGLNPS